MPLPALTHSLERLNRFSVAQGEPLLREQHEDRENRKAPESRSDATYAETSVDADGGLVEKAGGHQRPDQPVAGPLSVSRVVALRDSAVNIVDILLSQDEGSRRPSEQLPPEQLQQLLLQDGLQSNDLANMGWSRC